MSATSFECYFFRIWVHNEKGNQRAKRVQVYAAKLLRKQADGTFRQVDSFQPMNLRWAHSPDSDPIIFDDINPGMGKHCDLGHIVDPAHVDELGYKLPDYPNQKHLFHLDLEVKPATGSHLVPPGVYQLELRIAAANARPIEKRLEITLIGDWNRDQARMFSQCIGIKELN